MWTEIQIVNPNAEDLIDCFHSDEYNTLDFDSELIVGDKSDYWPFYQSSDGKCNEGFAVSDVATGDMIDINKKYTSVLVATIEQYEDPYEENKKLKDDIAKLKPATPSKKRGRKPKVEPTPATLERTANARPRVKSHSP